MIFNELAQWFDRLDRERSRLEMTRILSDLFGQLSSRESQIVAYFCMGELSAPYKKVQVGLADKTVLKVVARLLHKTVNEIEQTLAQAQDLGQVIESGMWHSEEQLSIEQVYEQLLAIAHCAGLGSQEAKIDALERLLHDVTPLAAKFILRIVLGILRLGFSDMTLMDSWSWMLVGNKSLSGAIEDAYNVCADIGLIASTVKELGIDGIRNMHVIVGVPIRPAAAERLASAQEIIDKIGSCVAEPKLDGFRLQIHINNIKINKTEEQQKLFFFSRNLLDMSAMYPDLVQALAPLAVQNVILEGEAISFDPNTGSFMPFQETVKRKRKHDIASKAQELPLQIFLFDILYLDGKSLMELPFIERRKKLVDLVRNSSIDKALVHVTGEIKINNAQELEHYFLAQIAAGLEGVVVKRTDAPYQPGKRNFNWIKLKRLASGHLLDSIDCVVLGYYYGAGKRAAFGIGALLVGVYNKTVDCFETVAKIGTGFSDHEWKEVRARCDERAVDQQPKNVVCDKNLFPDVWVRPELVLEITADEITRSPIHTAGKTQKELGVALRFPRFLRYRDDKNALETTSVEELFELYLQQRT